MNRSELIEAMVKAFAFAVAENDGGKTLANMQADWDSPPAELREAKAFISLGVESALTALEELGMVVVPRVATEAMVNAGVTAWVTGPPNPPSSGHSGAVCAQHAWTAMLTAAQTKDESHDR